MVCRKLHNEGSRVAGKALGLLEHDARADDCCHADEVCGGGYPCAAAEQCAGDHCNERNLCAAGDEGRGHDRHAAVTLVFDGTGSHDTRNAAADADEHGDEALAGEAELAEHTVKNEGDTRHVAAGLEEGEHEEQDEHLGNEAEDRADTGYDTVVDKAAEPGGCVCSVKAVADENGDARYPNAVISRIGSVKAVFLEVGNCINIGHLDNVVHLVSAFGKCVIISSHGVDREGLFILDVNGCGLVGGLESLHIGKQCVCVEVVCFNVNVLAEERADCLDSCGVFVVCVVIVGRADAQQVPAVAEHAVVCPVGCRCADGDHCDPVDKEHDYREDRQAQPTVGDDLIYLVGSGELAGVFLLVACLDDGCYVEVALVGDDALGIVVKLILGGLDVRVDVLHDLGLDGELCKHLVIVLEDLDCVPALLLFGQLMQDGLLDVSDCVLDNAGE